MKRALSFVLVLLALISLLPATAYADGPKEIILLDNGDYIVVTTEISPTRASGTRSGSTVYTYIDRNGAAQWKATLTATFTYNGTTSSCTGASCSVTVYESSWYEITNSASKSGSTATANITMGCKVLGITVSKTSCTITLSCDENGNLS